MTFGRLWPEASSCPDRKWNQKKLATQAAAWYTVYKVRNSNAAVAATALEAQHEATIFRILSTPGGSAAYLVRRALYTPFPRGRIERRKQFHLLPAGDPAGVPQTASRRDRIRLLCGRRLDRHQLRPARLSAHDAGYLRGPGQLRHREGPEPLRPQRQPGRSPHHGGVRAAGGPVHRLQQLLRLPHRLPLLRGHQLHHPAWTRRRPRW